MIDSTTTIWLGANRVELTLKIKNSTCEVTCRVFASFGTESGHHDGELLGHSTVTVTTCYTHSNLASKVVAVEKLLRALLQSSYTPHQNAAVRIPNVPNWPLTRRIR